MPKGKPPSKMYHCTTYGYLQGILVHGLQPRHPPDAPEQPVGVYLSKNPFEWMWRATDYGRLRGVMITVDVKGLPLHDDCGEIKAREGYKAHRGFYVVEAIPTDRFLEIAVENPETKSYEPLEGWP